MNRKAVEWLYEQLPELVEKGIIPRESADLIRNHYGQADKKMGGKTILTMFGVIGAIFVGLGIILILAHNWEQMSRMARTFLAVGILLAAQMLAGTVIWYKKESSAWTESTSTFLMAAMGASIALIGQTYHLADNFSTALLIWMVLSLPLVYLMKVTTPALLYLAGITIWVSAGEFSPVGKQFIWVLLGGVIPYYWRLLKKDTYGNQPVVLTWAILYCFYMSFGTAFSAYLEHFHVLIYAALFALTYFVGTVWFAEPVKIWRRPFTLIGLTGCIGVSFLLTFRDLWRAIGRSFISAGTAEYFLVFLLLLFVVILGRKVSKTETDNWLLFGAVPLVAGAGFMLLYADNRGVMPAIFCNAYFLVLSITVILRGVRQGSLGVLNMGMIMVAALIIVRFFDMNFSFVARGLVFVLLGSCFLIANWVMVRRKKEVQHEKQ